MPTDDDEPQHFFVGDRLVYFLHGYKLTKLVKQEDRLINLRIKYSLTFAYCVLGIGYLCFLVAFFANEWIFVTGYDKNDNTGEYVPIYQAHISFLTASKTLQIKPEYEDMSKSIVRQFLFEERDECPYVSFYGTNETANKPSEIKKQVLRQWSSGRALCICGMLSLSWGLVSVFLSQLFKPVTEGSLKKSDRNKEFGASWRKMKAPTVKGLADKMKMNKKEVDVNIFFVLRLGCCTCLASIYFILGLTYYLETLIRAKQYYKNKFDKTQEKICIDHYGSGSTSMIIGIFMTLISFMFVVDVYDPA